jgi:predicted RNase H-like nuclease
MTTLLVGFDSAWTCTNSGALVGVLQLGDGTFHEFGPPLKVNYLQAQDLILKWQAERLPRSTIILLDQPTIVGNPTGQRTVEKIVCPTVSRRRGGMQPANTSRKEMFGKEAPIWPFLCRFGGPANPLKPVGDTHVIETYPVLALIALRCTLPDPDKRPQGRLPKYNPQRKTFSILDWQSVCARASNAFRERGLMKIVRWIDNAATTSPRKTDQDGLDGCLCLLVALYLVERKNCLMVGNQKTGYIVVPDGTELREELIVRCHQISCDNQTVLTPSEWVRPFRWPTTPR